MYNSSRIEIESRRLSDLYHEGSKWVDGNDVINIFVDYHIQTHSKCECSAENLIQIRNEPLFYMGWGKISKITIILRFQMYYNRFPVRYGLV